MTSDLHGDPAATAPRWRQTQRGIPPAAGESRLHRLLGGAPLAVLMRLVVVSLLVGACLVWLDLRPADIFAGVIRFAQRLWALGFDGLREFGTYILAGAAIVVPIWIVLRLLAIRPVR